LVVLEFKGLKVSTMKRQWNQRIRSNQKGSALVLTVLALLIVAAVAAAYFYRERINYRIAQGEALANEMKVLQLAANKAIFSSMGSLEKGKEMELPMYDGVTGDPIAPLKIPYFIDGKRGGAVSWIIPLEKLREAGLLGVGFLTDGKSSVLDGKYKIQIWRTPIGCEDAAGNATSCKVDGAVMLDKPIGTKGSGSVVLPDGIMRGAFGGKGGVDSGVTHFKAKSWINDLITKLLATDFTKRSVTGDQDSKKTILSLGSRAMPNFIDNNDIEDLPGLRVGSYNYHFDDLVHIDDGRNLSFGGNQNVGKTLGVVGDIQVGGTLPEMGRTGEQTNGGAPCVKIGRNGQVDIGCEGQVSLVKVVEGTSCVPSGEARAYDAEAPKQGTARYAALGDGSIAVCLPSPAAGASAAAGGTPVARWVALQRFRSAGQACGVGQELEGAAAVDSADHQGLICKGGQYLRVAALTSNLVLQDTLKLDVIPGDPDHAGLVKKPDCMSSGGQAGQAKAMLTPLEDSSLGNYPESETISGIDRFLRDEGDHWQVLVQKATEKTDMRGTVMVSVYCFYSQIVP
jgi:hypothetical protein